LGTYEAAVLAVRSGLFLLDFGNPSPKPTFCYKASGSSYVDDAVWFVTSIEKLFAGVLWVLFGMAARFRLRIR
jgi:hypothetical protein